MKRYLLLSATAVVLFWLSVTLPAQAVEVPPFLKIGKQYIIYWAGGNAGNYSVLGIDKSGWLKVSDSPGNVVWINLEHIIKIQPLK